MRCGFDASGCADGARPGEGEPLRILIANSVLATPDRDSGALRLFRIVELLLEQGHEITFISRDSYREDREIAPLVALGVDVYPLDLDHLRTLGARLPGVPYDFPKLLARGRFDVALLSFFHVAEQYLPLIRRHSPLTRIVIDTVDIHHVRERRQAELSGDPAAFAAAEQTRRREQAIYSAADALVAVSAPEADELAKLAPAVPRFVISNIHAPVGPTPGFEARQGLIFVGSFPHIPNVDAVLDFHRTAWPLVRSALPEPQLTVVGTKPPPQVMALRSPEVEVTGWVPEVAPYLDRARVSIAPLRYGAGVKGKIGEALSRGVPVVTTSIGAEGMGLRNGEQALVADRAEDFAAAITRVHEDRALWQRLSRAGRAHIESTLGLEAARADMLRLLAGVVNTPFVTAADGADARHALKTFTSAFAPGDSASLVLTVPEDDHAAAQRAFDAAAQTLAAEGLAPDAVADIQIAATAPDASLPTRAVLIGDGNAAGTRAVSAGEPAERWRQLATVASARRRPRVSASAAVVLHAHDDVPALSAQLDAVRAAGLPDHVDVVVAADMPGREMQTLLDSLADVRVIRGTIPLGRHQAWQVGAMASDAPYVVALSPLTIPAPGFAQALIRALRDGATIAGPRVAGAAGLHVAADGSLWPRAHEHDGDLDALELDCLAMHRELITAGLPAFPRGEGHVESQLAAWAAQHGRLGLAGEARVERLPAPPASVIVCTRNRAEELPDGIALLRKAGASEIIIVDNDSTDDTAAVAAELAERSGGVVRVVDEPRGGLCHARNAGAAAASHNLLVYVDDDARPAPGWLNHITHTLARPGVANAGGPISALWPANRPPDWPGRAHEPFLSVLDLGDQELVLQPPHFVYGANWAVRRDALSAVGGFDPQFGPGPDARINGDEVSVAARLFYQQLGRTVYSPGAAVGHRISPDRIDDDFLLHRSLCVGIERPRHVHALGQCDDAELLDGARSAAQRVFAVARLEGALTVAGALERIASAPGDRATRMNAAMALGELAASVVLLGEREALIDGLRLRIDGDALLRGVLTEPKPEPEPEALAA